MTEQEWIACGDPATMLEALKGKAGDRKLRLFASACCRVVWQLLIDERSRVAVEAAERISDGLVSESEAQIAFSSACAASLAVRGSPDASPDTILRLRRQHNPGKLSRAAVIAGFAVGSGVGDVQAHIQGTDGDLVDAPLRCRLLGDIFGPLPFRRVRVDATWLTPAVIALAQSSYDERAFDTLPVLADALEDAGCTDTDLLNRCRQPGQHVRGFWAVDLLLGDLALGNEWWPLRSRA